jgi:hydroxymethylbilane synthase
MNPPPPVNQIRWYFWTTDIECLAMNGTENPVKKLVLGTRGSMLAVAQSNWVAEQLRRNYPAVEVAIKLFTTRGDRSAVVAQPLQAVWKQAGEPGPLIGGLKGLFTAELEDALRDGTIDLAVHSAKDLPTDLADGTSVLAWPAREDPRDALVIGTDDLAPGSLADIPIGAKVGTSSLRRIGQLRSLRPDLDVQPIRGNIDTRIAKVRRADFAATLLAVAGLKRTGLLAHAAQILSIDQMTPAAGQAALAIQGRAADPRVGELLASLDDPATRQAVLAERRVVARLAGGCNMPLGVHIFQQGPRWIGRAVLVAPIGHPRIDITAQTDTADLLPDMLVDQLLAQGGGELLKAANF